MSVTVIAGGFWGDEGKGKVCAYLAVTDRPAVIARAGVGPNAGHTFEFEGRKYIMRQVPCGFIYPQARLLIGPGVLIDPDVVQREIEVTGVAGRLGIDAKCTVIEAEHIQADKGSAHLSKTVGTTGTGCGPANEARTARRARLAREVPDLQPLLADVAEEVNEAIAHGQSVLIEGTQGFGLSLYHGDYPFVTSKDTTASTFCADVGIGPTRVTDVIVIFKAYASRVGQGPFPTELPLEEVQRRGWEEFGAVTGRRRRIGEFDFAFARRSAMLNGATQLAITNLDRRFPETLGVTRRENLPAEAQIFLARVAEEVGVPVTLISTGPKMEHMIDER